MAVAVIERARSEFRAEEGRKSKVLWADSGRLNAGQRRWSIPRGHLNFLLLKQSI
jgi:hypothetical protein